MKVKKHHIPMWWPVYTAVTILWLVLSYLLATNWNAWLFKQGEISWLGSAVVGVDGCMIFCLLWYFRRSVIGYKVYIGFDKGEIKTVEIWEPLEPARNDHGIVVNLATRRCTWLTGHRDTRPLISTDRCLRLANSVYDVIPRPVYNNFLDEANYVYIKFQVMNLVNGGLNLDARDIARLVNKNIGIRTPEGYNAIESVAVRFSAVKELRDTLSQAFIQTSRLQHTIEGAALGIRLFELKKILEFYSSHDIDRDITALKARLVHLEAEEAKQRKQK